MTLRIVGRSVHESLSATKIIGNCLFTVLIGLIVAYAVHRFFIIRKSRLSLGFLFFVLMSFAA
jgi:hypothetical protein